VQLDVVTLTLDRVHGLPVKLPAAVPVLVKATVPAGGLAAPTADVSFTNAVQLMACATTTALGEQTGFVDVVLNVTVTVLLVPEDPLWLVSVAV